MGRGAGRRGDGDGNWEGETGRGNLEGGNGEGEMGRGAIGAGRRWQWEGDNVRRRRRGG